MFIYSLFYSLHSNISKPGNAKCILGYLTVLSPHESPVMQTRRTASFENASRTLPGLTAGLRTHREHSRVWSLYLTHVYSECEQYSGSDWWRVTRTWVHKYRREHELRNGHGVFGGVVVPLCSVGLSAGRPLETSIPVVLAPGWLPSLHHTFC